MNKIVLTGHLTQDPEVRFTPGGAAAEFAGVSADDIPF